MTRPNILVVDDEPNIRESLRMILSRSYEVSTADNGEQALELVNTSTPDLIIVDVMMPGLDGMGLLQKVKTDFPKIPVIMVTASKALRPAVDAMKIGAVDYLSKPFDVDELITIINSSLDKVATATEAIDTIASSRGGLAPIPGDFGCMIGKHPLMQELFNKVEQLAQRDTTVLITGESGTGKELIAREIHLRSSRREGPFIALNCAAIPETLIESELFGHEKGAFTHAVEKRLGHFELADGGTLFLDEIGELSLPVQVKMLRFLQDHEFYRVGRSKPQRVDVRIVAATNKNLENAIREGSFRQDLFYRINVVSLEMPPLRDRAEDIPELFNFFLKRLSPLYGNKPVAVSPEAMELVQSYAWPGNVRELENVVESLLALNSCEQITPELLPARIREHASPSTNVLTGQLGFAEAEREFERELILKALHKANFVQTRAAELLGISRRILKYKMDKLGISDSPQEKQ